MRNLVRFQINQNKTLQNVIVKYKVNFILKSE